jgi:hypothetical protein
MNEFTMLRARAREQRDNAIALARSTYETALNQITALENVLLERGKPKIKRISDCIGAVMPTDRPFTVEDIQELLQAAHPTRIWNKAVVSNHIGHMRNRGVIYRARKPKRGHNAVYAAKGVKVATSAFGDKPLSEVMLELLTEPMRPVELAVRILESDYDTNMSRENMRTTVSRLLRTNGSFRKVGGGKWEAR